MAKKRTWNSFWFRKLVTVPKERQRQGIYLTDLRQFGDGVEEQIGREEMEMA